MMGKWKLRILHFTAKNHSCDICAETFTQKDMLKNHLAEVHFVQFEE